MLRIHDSAVTANLLAYIYITTIIKECQLITKDDQVWSMRIILPCISMPFTCCLTSRHVAVHESYAGPQIDLRWPA